MSATVSQVVEGTETTVTVNTGGVTFAQSQTLVMVLSGTATDGDDYVLLDTGDRPLQAPYELTLAAGATSTSLKIAETVVVEVRHGTSVVGTVTVTLIEENHRPLVIGGVGSGTVLDYEAAVKTYTPSRDFNGTDIFTYLASDGRLTHEAIVIVTVAPVNDQPKFPARSTTRSVPEGAPPGSPVGSPVQATDIDAEPLTHELFEEDAPFFTIDADTGQIRVGADTVLDRTTKTSCRDG